ncbi:hypothetical protein D3C71_1777090 [compost metagenome]
MKALGWLGGATNRQSAQVSFLRVYGVTLAGLPSRRRTSSMRMPGTTRAKFSGVSTWRNAVMWPSGPMVIM